MGRQLIVDTALLIDYERGVVDRSLFDQDDVAIAAVTVAEFRTGIEFADTVSRAADRTMTLEAILSTVEVLSYTADTAVQHARLIAHARRSGRPRGHHDLIIASHAVQTGRVLVSTDAAARFGDLPGVRVESA